MKIILTWLLTFYVIQNHFIEASDQCGIRKYLFTPRMHRGWAAEEGQWPWHVGLFTKTNGDLYKYACGGTLLNQKHVLTSAHCVVNPRTHHPLPKNIFELHFGQYNIDHIEDHVQVRRISEVHVHPDHSTHQNDIAMLVLEFSVQYTDFVNPICLDQRTNGNLQNLEGKRGWITGWGSTDSGVISDVLRTASMPVVSYLECFHDDHILYGNLLNPNVFCAGERNGTSPGKGDSGGGMYFSDGDIWVLRGIVSFAKADARNRVDTSKFTVFVNVQQFLTWIKQIMDKNQIAQIEERPKRTSEKVCDRFHSLIKERKDGSCSNARYSHVVTILYPDGDDKCNGVLLNENHVLTACNCKLNSRMQRPSKVEIDGHRTVDISKVTCHPEYEMEYLYHDLAIIKLSTAVELSSKLIPACLVSNWTENLNRTLIQTGYVRSPFSGASAFINSDKNQFIDKEQCDKLSTTAKKNPFGIMPAQFCAVSSDRLKANYKALSGTALQSVNSGTCMSTIVGVMSSENFGPNLTAIEVYTRVSYHLDWIEQIVWNVRPPSVGPFDGRFHVPLKYDSKLNARLRMTRVFMDGYYGNTISIDP